MAEFPILFSAPMVLAILAGRKTMTRRVFTRNHSGEKTPIANAVIGDTLYGKETFGHVRNHGNHVFRCDGAYERNQLIGGKWTPSIFMPRWASRIDLHITAIRDEPLRAISRDDAIAEGLQGITKDGTLYKYGIPDRDGLPGTDDYGWPWSQWDRDPVASFRKLWDGINAKRGYGWDTNPKVRVFEFVRVKP